MAAPIRFSTNGAGQRPAVSVDVNGHLFRTTVGVMAGMSLIPVNAATRKETGLQAGDAITVRLTVAEGPRAVHMPADFAAALAAGGVRPFFDALSNSLQRYHVDTINGAKTDDTRQRRIAKAVELFAAGKQR
ncbi:MAG: YdeI/OmpD-associated family protein [Actinomycetota bacterium]|nr:YdeI/OmpD-associated family protein [Actinomycetota bacterium]